MQQTQSQKPIALTPADALGARFCEYFNHPWKHIYAPVPAQEGEKPQWRASKYFLDPRTLWRKYQDPDTIIGLRFGEETRYALIDIDRESVYHPANDPAGFKSVLAALEEIGLCRPRVVQSSWSGGLHVYYFLPEPISTFDLACAIKFALEDAGNSLRSGQLESFPNTKAWGSYYNACRLPLQDGSFWLDDDLQPLTDDLTLFLDAADLAAANQDLTALQEYCAQARKRYEPRRIGDKPKGDAEEWKRDLEARIAEGWTGHGQTNNLLKDMVCYGIVWLGASGSALEDWVITTATAAPGYQQWCRHQHEIRERVRDWIRSTESLNRYYSPYCSYPERLGSYKKMVEDATNNVVPFKSRINEERSAQAQDRIKQIVSALEAAAALPKAVVGRIKGITAKAKEIFGSAISKNTLWKYLALWHPKYYKPEPVLQEKSLLSEDPSEIPTPPPCSTETNPQLESLEPLPSIDFSENSHTPPLMKVCGMVSGTAAPLGQPCPAHCLEEGGESEGGDLPPTASTAPAAPAGQEPEVVTAIAPETLESRRLTRIRLELNRLALKQVARGAFGVGGEKRRLLEQAAKFRLYWESGEPTLRAEATEWAIANPDALPEALPSPSVVAQDKCFHDVPSKLSPSQKATYMGEQKELARRFLNEWRWEQESLGVEDASTAGEPPREPLPLKVGDRVWWEGCPGHCSWANPFTITAIEGDNMAWLDLYSRPVPLRELRL